MLQITQSANNTNGCPIPATWFTLEAGSSCDVIKSLYQRGDGFADHTTTHLEMSPGTPVATITAEIVGGRNYLVQQCGIPASDVTGYRSPYLVENPPVRQVLLANGFRYDSSMDFSVNDGNMSARVWPFTMDYGVPDADCDKKFEVCGPGESYPGLWQIPMWDLVYQNQIFTMDPGRGEPGNGQSRPTYDVLQYSFDQAYNGNRAPLPIYVHVFWYNNQSIADTQRFIQYALSKPDTYFVTMQQLVNWLENPVPASQMPAWLSQQCGQGGGGAPAPAPSLPLSWTMNTTDFRPAILGRKLLG